MTVKQIYTFMHARTHIQIYEEEKTTDRDGEM